MIRRPPRSTLDRSSAASDVYKRQIQSSPLSSPFLFLMPEKIGFVGVGRMGANMARRLKDVGYSVAAVYDVRNDSAETVATEVGAEACRSLARVTQLSEYIITVVTDDAAMRAIFPDKKDNLLKGSAGRVFINCATVSYTHL